MYVWLQFDNWLFDPEKFSGLSRNRFGNRRMRNSFQAALGNRVKYLRKSCFLMSLTSSSSSRNRNKNGGIWFFLQRKSVFVDKLHCNRREHSLKNSWSTISTFRHVSFRNERTTVTSETSENTTFARFYFTLCYLIRAVLLHFEIPASVEKLG